MSQNPETSKRITRSNLIYEINEDAKTVDVVSNDKASGDVLIPNSIKINKKVYQVIAIKEGSFANSNTIRSIRFSENSEAMLNLCTNMEQCFLMEKELK